MKINKEQFLASITTLSARFDVGGSAWQDKIKEIDELGLKKVAIFPTCLGKKQRQAFYRLLEKTGLKQIPFIHLRSDMPPEELEYLIQKFKTQAFNIHPEKQYPLLFDLLKYKHLIFIENTVPLDEEEIENFAGLCLDFSHLERDKILYPEKFQHSLLMTEKYKIGGNHISAIAKEPRFWPEDSELHYDLHTFSSLSEFDYLKEYPKELFSNYIAIELENSLKEQLQAIDYICEILNN